MFGYLKQSTASQSRLVGPFVDDTDFKTLETGLTIANTDVKLSKNGGTGANKNSGGGTHRNNGMYSLTFNATDTNTVGELAGSISVAGALVVTFKFWVLEEDIYDAVFGASAAGFDSNQRVDVGEWLGNAVTASSGNPDVNIESIDSNAITAASIAASALDGKGDWSTLTTAQVNAECDTAISDAALATAANLATVDTVVDGIKAKTDSLTFTQAGNVDANIQYVNDVQVGGTGAGGDEWGPA